MNARRQDESTDSDRHVRRIGISSLFGHCPVGRHAYPTDKGMGAADLDIGGIYPVAVGAGMNARRQDESTDSDRHVRRIGISSLFGHCPVGIHAYPTDKGMGSADLGTGGIHPVAALQE